MRITWAQALTWRLRRQLLQPPGGCDAVDVVRRLCGVQAQVPSAARLAVAVRMPVPASVPASDADADADADAATDHTSRDHSSTDPDAEVGRDVAGALTQHRLVRTWAMRGTLHLLAADTLADHLALLCAPRTWEKGNWQRSFADAATMARLADLVPSALAGPPLTREELVSVVAGQVHDAALAQQLRSGWSTVLKPLSWQGLLIQGPSRGGRVTFTPSGPVRARLAGPAGTGRRRGGRRPRLSGRLRASHAEGVRPVAAARGLAPGGPEAVVRRARRRCRLGGRRGPTRVRAGGAPRRVGGNPTDRDGAPGAGLRPVGAGTGNGGRRRGARRAPVSGQPSRGAGSPRCCSSAAVSPGPGSRRTAWSG